MKLTKFYLNISIICFWCLQFFTSGCSNEIKTNHCLEKTTNKIEDSSAYIESKDSALTSSSFFIAASPSNKVCRFYLLTTRHSLDGITSSDQFKVTIRTGSRKDHYPIKLVKSFDSNDLAIVSFESSRIYPVMTLSRKKPALNSDILVVGSIKCHLNRAKELHELYQNRMTKGRIEDRDYIDKNRHEFHSLNLKEVNNYEKTKKSDLYYTNSSVDGMSGAPIIIIENNSRQVVGVQQSTLTPQSAVDDCGRNPTNLGSLGISIEKFLSQDIPREVKDGLILTGNTFF
jgi:Trypsin-like peptidase domain